MPKYIVNAIDVLATTMEAENEEEAIKLAEECGEWDIYEISEICNDPMKIEDNNE